MLKSRHPLLRAALLLLLCWLLFLLADRLDPLPDVQASGAQVVLARDGQPLWRFADDEGVWRYPVTLDEVSPLYLQALLGYEDRWFHLHPGINPPALLRAFWLNLRHGRIVSGGSTLSMQVARIIEPHDRTWQGKLRQIWRTLQLEWHHSKDEILEIYLNRAPFGGTLEGVSAASWAYLSKPASELTHAEAALLAVLPQAPSRLRPDRHPLRARAARDKLLQRLHQHGSWPAQQIDEALAEEIWLSPRQEPALAPLLARRLRQPHSGRIQTTINFALQQRLEQLLAGWKHHLPPRVSAAIVVAETASMEVRAYLGSADLHDEQRAGHVDMIQAVRSPGSTLKPFLYALALEDGLIHSESLLQDVPRHHASYQPGNFARGFGGPISASEALLNSLNLPAVQLLEHYGSQRFDARLQQAGIRLHYPGDGIPNLALILGGIGMKLEDLVSTYAALGRNGSTAPLRYQPDTPLQTRPLTTPGSAWVVQRILSGHLQPNSTEQRRRQGFAWKTGTSHGHRDALALGVGNGYVIGVWVGRPDGTPVPGQYGQVSATPLLLQVYDILAQQPGRLTGNPPQPPAVGVAAICWPGGQPLAADDDNCRRQRIAWTLDGITPPTLNLAGLSQPVWQRFWINDRGQQVAADCDTARPADIALWPATLEPWLPATERRSRRLPPSDSQCPPASQPLAGELRILGVTPGARLQLPPLRKHAELTVEFTAEGASGQLWWFLNGRPLQQTDDNTAFQHAFTRPGKQQLSVIDSNGQTALLEFSTVLPVTD